MDSYKVIFSIFGAVALLIAGQFFLQIQEVHSHVWKKTFDECFNHYASGQEKGISVDLIRVCKEKANSAS
jgi:hypothetical protein